MKQRNTARRTTRSKRSNRSRRPRKAIRKRYTGGDNRAAQLIANQAEIEPERPRADYVSPPTTRPPPGEGWHFALVVPTERTLYRLGAGMVYEYVRRDDGRFDVYSRFYEEPRENNNRRT